MHDTLRHLLNPLHVYCRLLDMGVGTDRVRWICTRYERIYRLFL